MNISLNAYRRSGRPAHSRPYPSRSQSRARGVSLVEVMVATVVFTVTAFGGLSSMAYARRAAEDNVIRNAAVSIIYGLVEQMKTVTIQTDPSTNRLPSPPDADCASPHIKVRIDNSPDTDFPLVISTSDVPGDLPPTATTAAAIGATPNILGPFDMSQLLGTNVQPLTLEVWLWVEPDYQPVNMDPVHRVTLIYTYTFNSGQGEWKHRDCVRFVRAGRAIPRKPTP